MIFALIAVAYGLGCLIGKVEQRFVFAGALLVLGFGAMVSLGGQSPTTDSITALGFSLFVSAAVVRLAQSAASPYVDVVRAKMSSLDGRVGVGAHSAPQSSPANPIASLAEAPLFARLIAMLGAYALVGVLAVSQQWLFVVATGIGAALLVAACRTNGLTLVLGAIGSLISVLAIWQDYGSVWHVSFSLAIVSAGAVVAAPAVLAFLGATVPTETADTRTVAAHRRLAVLSDVGLVAIAGAITLLIAVRLLSNFHEPAEDAAMLMRYAANFANGHGPTWNPGQNPVDGATDFGFAILLGATMFVTRLSASNAVTLLDLSANLGLVALTYFGVRRLYGQSGLIAAAAAIIAGVGPGLLYTQARFGTPVFGLAAGATWLMANFVVRKPTASRARGFALVGMAMSLVRPEGVLLFAFIYAGLMLNLEKDQRRPVTRQIVQLYIPIGLVYFAFHWVYFGHPLPNPFYKKGGGQLYTDGLNDAVDMITTWLPWIAGVVLIGALVQWRRWRQSLLLIGPVVGFTVIWILLSNETNYAYRFQYPSFVMLCMGWPMMLQGLTAKTQIAGVRLAVLGAGAVAVVGTSVVFVNQYDQVSASASSNEDGRHAVGVALHPFAQGHTLATTEAGLLPLYSGWKAIDLWGLNDEYIAHNGLDDAYLDKAQPDVMLVHYFPTSPLRGWTDMEDTAMSWAEQHGYVLAAAYGPPSDSSDLHVYFVKLGRDTNELVGAIRSVDYRVYGVPAVDYSTVRGFKLPTGSN